MSERVVSFDALPAGIRWLRDPRVYPFVRRSVYLSGRQDYIPFRHRQGIQLIGYEPASKLGQHLHFGVCYWIRQDELPGVWPSEAVTIR